MSVGSRVWVKPDCEGHTKLMIVPKESTNVWTPIGKQVKGCLAGQDVGEERTILDHQVSGLTIEEDCIGWKR